MQEKEASGFLRNKKFLIETGIEESARKGSKWVPGDQEILHRNRRRGKRRGKEASGFLRIKKFSIETGAEESIGGKEASGFLGEENSR